MFCVKMELLKNIVPPLKTWHGRADRIMSFLVDANYFDPQMEEGEIIDLWCQNHSKNGLFVNKNRWKKGNNTVQQGFFTRDENMCALHCYTLMMLIFMK